MWALIWSMLALNCILESFANRFFISFLAIKKNHNEHAIDIINLIGSNNNFKALSDERILIFGIVLMELFFS